MACADVEDMLNNEAVADDDLAVLLLAELREGSFDSKGPTDAAVRNVSVLLLVLVLGSSDFIVVVWLAGALTVECGDAGTVYDGACGVVTGSTT